MTYTHLRRTLTVVAALCLLTSSGSATQQSPTAATHGAAQNAALEELAGALVASGSEGERERLLAASPELLTADLRKALSARGEKLRADGDYARALAAHQAALSVAQKLDDAEGVAQTLANIGGVYRSQGDYPKALASYGESVKRWEALGRPAGMARTLSSIGVLRYFQGEYDAALDSFQSALKLLEGSDDKDTAAGALNGIGAVHRERGEYDLDSYTSALYSLHPELRLQRGEAPQASLTQLNDLLGHTDAALVEYVVGDEQTFLFVVTGGGQAAAAPALKVYTLNIKRRELTDRVGRFRRQLSERDLLFGGAARALHELLLAPARAQLQGKTSLVIVPDDTLWELPFQALQSPAGRYALEEHAVSYAPSLSVLRAVALRRRGRAGRPLPAGELLAFGNPLPGGGNVKAGPGGMMSAASGALPEAERQVKTLGQIYGAAHSKVYTGAEAREDRFKAEAGK